MLKHLKRFRASVVGCPGQTQTIVVVNVSSRILVELPGITFRFGSDSGSAPIPTPGFAPVPAPPP